MSNFNYTRPEAFPPIVKNLIIINVLVFAAEVMFNTRYQIEDLFALYPIGYGFKPYQVATHMFTHSRVDPFHIVFNMLALYVLGRILENVWGPKRFLLFYLLCGVGAAAVHLIVQYLTGGFDAAVGASGAIMGLFAAFAYLFPNTELYIMFIPIPVKAKWAAIGYVAYDLYAGFRGSDNVAHFAHLGGALTGIIIVLIWNKGNRKRFY